MTTGTGLSFRCYRDDPMEQFRIACQKHKERYGALPYRVVLSASWKELTQEATSLAFEGQDVVVGYRRNQDRYTVGCDTTKQGNRGIHKRAP